jgi:hypothetical protein
MSTDKIVMNTVFVVEHVSASEDVKFVGVYRSCESACAAIDRLKTQSGFCDHPRLLDTLKDDEEAGFSLPNSE